MLKYFLCLFLFFMTNTFWYSDKVYYFSPLFGKVMLQICLRKLSLFSSEHHALLLLAVVNTYQGFVLLFLVQAAVSRGPCPSTGQLHQQYPEQAIGQLRSQDKTKFQRSVSLHPNISILCSLKTNFICIKSFICFIQNSVF